MIDTVFTDNESFDSNLDTSRNNSKSVNLFDSGVYRIGSSVEFDYILQICIRELQF